MTDMYAQKSRTSPPALEFELDPGLIQRLGGRVLRRLAGQLDHGRLVLRWPNESRMVLRGAGDGPEAVIEIESLRLLWRLARHGALGFAESYLRGEWDSPDLDNVFRLFISNREALEHRSEHLFKPRRTHKRHHARRENTRRGSRRNIAAHYDLGNDFFRLWLDESMSYSGAIYETGEESLFEAQQLKLEAVLQALDLRDGDSLLEIGCGWGGLAEAALAHRPNRYYGVTLSQEQLVWSKKRLAALQPRPDIEFRLQDYRDIEGQFDRIASIEMVEAVGERYWPTYFEVLRDRLKPGGKAVLQAITIDETLFDDYRRKPDFIQTYIFPGGMLPTGETMRRHAGRAGLRFETVRLFGPDYARTLDEWRRLFEANWPRIEQQGFDRRFQRMWLYYLAYCLAGFEQGSIQVGLYRLEKPE